MPQKFNAEGRILDFNSKTWESDDALQAKVQEHLENDDLRQALITAFELPSKDSFRYWAHIPVTLGEMQHIVSLGDVNGLHHWYSPDPSHPAPVQPAGTHEKPSRQDVECYIAAFAPASSALPSLRALEAGGKSHSIRRRVAAHLLSKRHLHPSVLAAPRRKQPHWNPGLEFWAWYCRATSWCGPTPLSGLRSVNHPALPVLMHHFGCVVPTWEALEVMRQVTRDGAKRVIEIGSGNGYWAYMLRKHGLVVTAIDNGQSVFRTNWIGDTIDADAVTYLGRTRSRDAGAGVLLMVYPVVSGDFTRKVLDAWQGDDIVVAGTQNGNGYTGFKDMTMNEWMAKERREWTKIAQIALPSYPTKDEVLYVFKRGQIEVGEEKDESETEGIVQGPGKNAKANAKKKARKKAKAAQASAADASVETEDTVT